MAAGALFVDGDRVLLVRKTYGERWDLPGGYVDCGPLGDDAQSIQLDRQELDQWEWVPVDELAERTIPRLARRIQHAYEAYGSGTVAYLEHGASPTSAGR
ncbi:NUDIX hydrolase [Lentzea tibetensis]|nr:hypothetical protein [Lentzea tibetensis]